MSRKPNLIGKVFGKLTVIEDAGIRKMNAIWLCKCECGETKVANTYHLQSASVRSCGCIRSGGLPGGIRNLGKGVAVANLIISMYRKNAQLCNRVFELTKEQCMVLFSGNCYYCDEPPSRTRVNRRTKDSFTYNGIDRLNNDIGYVLDNCVSCCRTCNTNKAKMSVDHFLSWIKKIADKHLKQ